MDDNQSNRPKPKLDRRNAIKNIQYDASATTSSSSSSRGNHSPLSDHQASFRVRGIDGEFDVICRSLGLSGPEDFSIPIAAWEAQRARSSSSHVTPRSRLHFQTHHHHDLQDDTPNAVVLDKSKPRVSLNGDINSSNLTKIGGNVRNAGGGGGGIKGIRPPPVILKSFSPIDRMAVDSPVCRDRMSVDSPVCVGDMFSSDEESLVVDKHTENGETEEVVSDVMRSLDSSPLNTENENVDFFSILRSNLEPVHSIFSPNGKFRRSVSSSWQKGQLLGSGSYGTVYEGFTDDGFFFAVKEVSLLDQGSQGKQSVFQLEQEISLLSQFEHDNIVQYLGTDKDETKLYIFLELVTKGSLANLYQKYLLRDSQVSGFTRQILSGLTYLHGRNVVHRDIKCANILVDVSGSVKLADFGLAKATKFNDVKSCKGTAYWMAPEVVNLRNRGYGLAADIWSLGCAVLEMLTRRPPYSHLEGMQALFQIGKGEPPPVPDSLSRDARDFIFKCLQVNPNNRPTAAQLLNHPFVKRPLSTSSVPASPRATVYIRERFGQSSVL